MFINRLEIGSAGEFSVCKSPEAVIDALLVDMNASDVIEQLDNMREMVVRRAADAAATIAPAMLGKRPGSEADRAIGP